MKKRERRRWRNINNILGMRERAPVLPATATGRRGRSRAGGSARPERAPRTRAAPAVFQGGGKGKEAAEWVPGTTGSEKEASERVEDGWIKHKRVNSTHVRLPMLI